MALSEALVLPVRAEMAIVSSLPIAVTLLQWDPTRTASWRNRLAAAAATRAMPSESWRLAAAPERAAASVVLLRSTITLAATSRRKATELLAFLRNRSAAVAAAAALPVAS